jgi:hypothetical protein
MRFPALVIIALLVVGCQQQGQAQKVQEIDQTNICEVKDLNSPPSLCARGQKVAFLPNRWGNEQYPIVFAAMYCDLRYSVALTNGGVACIYSGQTVAQRGDNAQHEDAASEKPVDADKP